MKLNRSYGWAALAGALMLAACGEAGDTGTSPSGGGGNGSKSASKSAGSAEPASSPSPLAAPGTDGVIAVKIAAGTQFDTGCMMDLTLTNASGQSFTLFADMGGKLSGEPVRPLRDIEGALTMEITGYTDAGLQIGPSAIRGRCEDLDLVVGNVRCREGVGMEGKIGPCPAPVSFTASEAIRSLKVK